MNHDTRAFAGEGHMNGHLVRGPMFTAVAAPEGNNLFQAAIYRMTVNGTRELVRLSARRVSYGEAFAEAAKMAGVPGYAG